MADKKVINFGAGPSKIPEEVMEHASREFLNFGGTGISILETSHRSKTFDDVLHKCQQDFRDLMDIPQHYKVVFLQGGGSGQFSSVPLNLRHWSSHEPNAVADYVVTGTWSQKAKKEGDKFLDAKLCIQPGLQHFTSIPPVSHWKLNHDAAYLYYCSNETVHGVEFPEVPDVHGINLVADISSNILTRHENIRRHAVLFAGAQKNMGAAGLTVAVVRDDLIGHAEMECPTILNYKDMSDANSVLNTPPVFSIYLTGLVLDWAKKLGGVSVLEERSAKKSGLIYNVIEKCQEFYHCPVDKSCRSRVNIPFRVGGHQGNVELEKLFLKEAEAEGMKQLKGHRSVGGMRASLYNAITVEETEKLAEFMHKFYDVNARHHN